MKKNLIGAVAAGLALALAFTGCESGNDNPVALPTDAALAKANKTVFVYTAKPDDYKYNGGTADAPSNETVGSIVWDSYIGGENAYNVETSATAKGTVSGTKVGDVILKKSESISLDVDAGTYAYSTASSSLKVFQVLAYDDAKAGYADVKLQKYKVVASGSADFDITAGSYSGSVYTASAITQGEVDELADAKSVIQTAIKAQVQAITDIKNDADATADSLKKANDDLQTLRGQLAIANGALYAIEKSETVDGVTTTTTTWLTALSSGKTVDTVETTSGTSEAVTGTYALASGNYVDGKILLTSYKDAKTGVEYEFDDDNGVYTFNGVAYGTIADDFKEGTAAVAASNETLTKTGRTLAISSKTITGAAVVSRVSGDPAVTTYDYLLGDGYATYAAAANDASTGATTIKTSSYNYVLVE